MPGIGLNIPVHVAGMVGGEGGHQLHDDLAARRNGTPPGWKRLLIRERGQPPRPQWWLATYHFSY